MPLLVGKRCEFELMHTQAEGVRVTPDSAMIGNVTDLIES